MANKPKTTEEPQIGKHGWKIYFTPEEVKYLRRKAREEGFKTAQERLRNQVRLERLAEKAKR